MPVQDGCPLCTSRSIQLYYRDAKHYQNRPRIYNRCERCHLVFVPSHLHLTPVQEKAHYDLHENNPEDIGYRQFLQRLAEPLVLRLPVASQGLDFGSGPGPTLHLMLQEAGHSVAIYDKFYATDTTPLSKNYDFITATEVVEHLALPGKVLTSLWSLLNPGGILALMTKRVIDVEAFASWHYKNDPTHIAFFSDETFLWLASQWGAECEFYGKDVVMLKKL